MTTYVMLGTTDDSTTCDKCGKVDLKMTVVVAELDEDGNRGEPAYFGSSCAARALGRKSNAIRNAALETNSLFAEARRWAKEFRALSFEVYAEVNAESARRFGRDLVADYAAVQTEVATIESGTLVGTRFERRLVKI